MRIIITYDIPCNRRRAKVAETLKDFGKRVQKSVFECNINDKQIELLLLLLKRFINSLEDHVMLYYLCSRCLKKSRSLGIERIEQEEEGFFIV